MRWHLIESVALEKPLEGSPCNGCGICCIASVCELGLALGDNQNCRALIRNHDGSFTCGLVHDPYSYLDSESLMPWLVLDELKGGHTGELALKEMNAKALGAGRGCDADDHHSAELLAEARRNAQLCLSFN